MREPAGECRVLCRLRKARGRNKTRKTEGYTVERGSTWAQISPPATPPPPRTTTAVTAPHSFARAPESPSCAATACSIVRVACGFTAPAGFPALSGGGADDGAVVVAAAEVGEGGRASHTGGLSAVSSMAINRFAAAVCDGGTRRGRTGGRNRQGGGIRGRKKKPSRRRRGSQKARAPGWFRGAAASPFCDRPAAADTSRHAAVVGATARRGDAGRGGGAAHQESVLFDVETGGAEGGDAGDAGADLRRQAAGGGAGERAVAAGAAEAGEGVAGRLRPRGRDVRGCVLPQHAKAASGDRK